jgi:hypothetical protein
MCFLFHFVLSLTDNFQKLKTASEKLLLSAKDCGNHDLLCDLMNRCQQLMSSSIWNAEQKNLVLTNCCEYLKPFCMAEPSQSDSAPTQLPPSNLELISLSSSLDNQQAPVPAPPPPSSSQTPPLPPSLSTQHQQRAPDQEQLQRLQQLQQIHDMVHQHRGDAESRKRKRNDDENKNNSNRMDTNETEMLPPQSKKRKP